MNANEIKFRCSSLGYIMTESRSKSDAISETCKTHLIDVFVSAKYGRNTDIFNKFTNKGMMVEQDSLTLYSRYKSYFFRKNEKQLSNEFISGTPDIIGSENKLGIASDTVIDIKSSWDIFTFFRNASPERMNKNYYWQLMGYMALTGASKAIVAYCLVDTPEVLINDEKRKLMWKMNIISDEDKSYVEACEEIDKLSRYSDIPMDEKVREILILRDDEVIEKIYQRVKDCREFMNTNLFNEEVKLVEQSITT
jgi:hypothetical protein